MVEDGNKNNQKDEHGNLLCQLSPHLQDLPGRYFYALHPKTGLPTIITIDNLIDDYGEVHQQDPTCEAHFEIRFT